MGATKKLDISSWKRKEHFEFFKNFNNPFWEITVEIDCTKGYQKAKELNCSFFAYYLHKSAKAINNLEEFRYRISGDDVLIYDKINVSCAIGREDNTFAFSYIDYHNDIHVFAENVRNEIEDIQKGSGIRIKEDAYNLNYIHCTAVPWLKFTGLKLALHHGTGDSVPKISFGKCYEKEGSRFMPTSLHAHHSLVDGYHAHLYFELFQELMDND